MTDLARIVADLRAEGDELYQFLLTLDEADWSRATTFKSWTVNDVVAHLYFGDYLGVTSHKDGQAFKNFMAEVQSSGLTLAEFTREWLHNLSGPEMLERWAWTVPGNVRPICGQQPRATADMGRP